MIEVALSSLDVTKRLHSNIHNRSDIAFIRKSLILYDKLAFNVMEENCEWEGMVTDIIGPGATSKIEKHMRKSLVTSDFFKLKERIYKEIDIMLRASDRQKIDQQKLMDYLNAYFENESLLSNPPWSDPLHVPFQFPALAITREAGVSYIPNQTDYQEIGRLFDVFPLLHNIDLP